MNDKDRMDTDFIDDDLDEEMEEEEFEVDFAELKEYFDECWEMYESAEWDGGFSAFFSQLYLDVPWLIKYAKVLESGDTEGYVPEENEADRAWLLAMSCDIASEENLFKKYPELIEHIDMFMDEAYNDWLAIFPKKLCEAGQYLQSIGQYDKAYQCFFTGAQIDYDGRQTLYPFVHVADCMYELGLCYAKGLGIDQDYTEAMEFFKIAAKDENCYLRIVDRDYYSIYLPAMGDLYLYGHVAEQSYVQALKCYFPGGKEPQYYTTTMFTGNDYHHFYYRRKMMEKIFVDYPRKEQLKKILQHINPENADEETKRYLELAKNLIENSDFEG